MSRIVTTTTLTIVTTTTVSASSSFLSLVLLMDVAIVIMSMSCLLVYVSDEYEWYRTTFNTVLVMFYGFRHEDPVFLLCEA